MDRLEQEVDAVQRDLRDRAAEVDRISRREDTALLALEAAARSLDRQRREARACREELEELDRRISAIQAAEADLLLRIAAGRQYLSGRLVALYKTDRLGVDERAGVRAVHPRSRHAQGRPADILDRDRRALDELRDHETELAGLQALLTERRARQLALAAEYDRRLATVSRERSGRGEGPAAPAGRQGRPTRGDRRPAGGRPRARPPGPDAQPRGCRRTRGGGGALSATCGNEGLAYPSGKR